MLVLGITGNIGTGKSTFTKLLAAELDSPVFDTDQCSRQLLDKDQAVRLEVISAFGKHIYSSEGILDRIELRKLVFTSKEARTRLEKILHPRVRASWTKEVQNHKTIGHPYPFIVEIPLLFETKAESELGKVLVVGCSKNTQMWRLTTQRGLDPEMVTSIEASQMPLKEKMQRCDFLVWNDGSHLMLKKQACNVARRINQQ